MNKGHFCFNDNINNNLWSALFKSLFKLFETKNRNQTIPKNGFYHFMGTHHTDICTHYLGFN